MDETIRHVSEEEILEPVRRAHVRPAYTHSELSRRHERHVQTLAQRLYRQKGRPGNQVETARLFGILPLESPEPSGTRVRFVHQLQPEFVRQATHEKGVCDFV